MKPKPLAAMVLAACTLGAAHAALPVGAPAPVFTAEAALGGRTFTFSLAEALREGPVVLYFYPKAFTSGCTIEAHAFAEATPQFQALGARVIGMSADDIATLQRFSVEACGSKFPVAADREARVIRQYDAALAARPDTADRISYVIGPQGRVLHVHAGSDPLAHVRSTLQAVEAWRRSQAGK
ncbi:peroxiredoxin [Caldimonas thermodepolymerans]|jgi:Peroxiredoxin|uniref:thioredoxin-dependent peroxiredoxin n=1 Tax=Caldimonas thermodepolymerans TaxID=215580 RepID=A0A2S5T9G4_9BURK|nr:peroxiredoxin [Caldimonas thermodepolymerans]QPC30647.1 peroxiredoxin [Caldimonas thermodepolymerans]RDI02745.1 peroxiredoxin [Caldimonas thermodepolymerans]